jgi:hypothetical protein
MEPESSLPYSQAPATCHHVALEQIFLQVFSFYILSNIPATAPVHACLQASAVV